MILTSGTPWIKLFRVACSCHVGDLEPGELYCKLGIFIQMLRVHFINKYCDIHFIATTVLIRYLCQSFDCIAAAELGDSSSDSGKDKTKKKRCTLCKKRVGLTGL